MYERNMFEAMNPRYKKAHSLIELFVGGNKKHRRNLK